MTELEALRRWKAEAMIVMEELETAWQAAGRPGPLGGSKAANLGAEVLRLRALLDQRGGSQ